MVIGDGVTRIYSDVFYGCTSLTSITVDENNDNYKSIDGNLYTKYGKLIQYANGKKDASFIILDGVTNIGDWAFYGCGSLKSITIPSSVTSIGDYAFKNCDNLTRIQYRGTSSQWSAITKGANWYNSVGNYTIMYNW